MVWKITPQQPVPVDPLFGDVSLLLHGNGANGSTTIVDNSRNLKTVTAFSTAQISTAQSRFGGSSILINSGSYLSVADSDELDLQGDFTIECFLYPLSLAGTSNVVYFMGQYEVGDYAPIVPYFNNGVPGIAASANKTSFSVGATSGSALSLNTWTHIAWVRSVNRWSVYVGGTERVIDASNATIPYRANAPLSIGRHVFPASNQYPYSGYIDELRISRSARYTANFTPPTAPFPDI